MHHKRRNALRALVAAPLGMLLSPAACAKGKAPAVGSTLTLPDLRLIEGGRFRAAEADGEVAVIYWWASWCPFCREMTPDIEKLWRTQGGRGLVVLGISIDKDIDAARSYRRRHGYTFPSALYDASLEPLLPRPSTVPFTWVRDRNGRIVQVEKGQLFPEDVAEFARHL